MRKARMDGARGAVACAAWMVVAAVTATGAATAAGAELRLPRVFTDHMVLQRQMPIAVWGWADGGAAVTVSFNGATAKTKADASGRWRVDLPAMEADGAAHTLRIESAGQTVERSDVLLGEVWLAAGQSNMNREVKVEGDHPRIRLFTIDDSTTPESDDLGERVSGWVVANEKDAAEWAKWRERHIGRGWKIGATEVGWVFALRIERELNVPVGIIKAAYGGAPVSAFTPVAPEAAEWKIGERLEGGLPAGLLYRSMIHGIVPMSIRGVLWYQGENDGRNADYAKSMTAWIGAWRAAWGRPDLPFYYVQISPSGYAGERMQYIWAAQQRVMQTVPHTGMAVSNDFYEGVTEGRFAPKPNAETGFAEARSGDPHPPNKAKMAERLARIALDQTYGKPQGVLYGPMYRSSEAAGDSIRVRFDHVGEGLATEDGAPPDWFFVSDGTRRGNLLVWHKAEAKVVGKDTVEVRAEGVAAPKFVRFAWSCYAVHNLRNSADLPAVSFQTDEDPR